MTSEPIIAAHDLRRTYGRGQAAFEAVRGIDLTVNQGELFALLGTNGAGKTSTLELIEGLAQPAGGSVRVLGKDPYRERADVRYRVGTMLQQAGFPSALTARETMAMWHGTVSGARAIDEVLAQVDLAHRANVRVASLSGGERRRLDLGLTLMGQPQLLILDEPTTGLDPQSRRLTWDLVRSYLARGVTVLLTTHYLDEAEELADRLAIMHEGTIVRSGTIDQIVASEPARITWRGTGTGLHLAALPSLVAAPVTDHGATTLRTRHLQSTLHALLAQAHDAQVELAHLEARAASLEQAFLAIAGSPDLRAA